MSIRTFETFYPTVYYFMVPIIFFPWPSRIRCARVPIKTAILYILMHRVVAISSGSSSACKTPASCFTSMNNLSLVNFLTKATQHNQGLLLLVLEKGKRSTCSSLCYFNVRLARIGRLSYYPDEVAISFVYSRCAK